MTRVNNVPRGSWNQPHEREHLDRRRRRRDRREQDNGEWFRLGHLARGLGVDAKLLHRWRISGRIETQLIANVWHAKLSEVADEVAIHRKKSA